MAKFTLSEDVRVDMRVHGASVVLDLAAGDVDLDEHVAAILTARGLASPARPKPKKTAETETETLEQT